MTYDVITVKKPRHLYGLLFSGSKTCSPEAFHCPGSHCVPQRWKCDGDKDCPDGADEGVQAGCSKYPVISSTQLFFCFCFLSLLYTSSCLFLANNKTCDDTEFQCQNKQCIPKHFVCDHDLDCRDGSDESPECGECFCVHLVSSSSWSQLFCPSQSHPGPCLCCFLKTDHLLIT